MSKLGKIGLYVNTVKHLKPSQVFYRIWRKAGGNTRLKPFYTPKPDVAKADIAAIPVLPELDFDHAFLSRFDVDAILQDRIELLHHEEIVDWKESWHDSFSTPLWRFNLHYCEYLMPLAKAYKDCCDECYLNKGKAIIDSWISNCPIGKDGAAWDSYTISMRIVNWLAFYGELADELQQDTAFVKRFNDSLAQQYVVISKHLEVDLLANHYLEDLKALTLLACYFNDEATLALVLPRFYGQIEEQILPDGMHFELSPMYHKIVLEDLLRVATVLQKRGGIDIAEKFRLQDMADCLYSMERHTNRTPLFNDSGDNVAKSRDALLQCVKLRFGIDPVFKSVLSDAGYCILERETAAGYVKVIFDAGMPGPKYAMGHVHCDALSFECFVNGEPWIVNCGTYAYQDESRLEYKKTLSHNTVMVNDVEQHECWAPFRVARYSKAYLEKSDIVSVLGAMTLRGREQKLSREITLMDDGLRIVDQAADDKNTEHSFTFTFGASGMEGHRIDAKYSPEFGMLYPACQYITNATDAIVIPYPAFQKEVEC